MSVGNRTQITARPDELVEMARRERPKLAEELQSWRCPAPVPLGDLMEVPRPGVYQQGRCNTRAVSVTAECSATMLRGVDEARWRALAHGAGRWSAMVEEVPAAYDLFFHCEHGHRTYIRTEAVHP